MTPLLWRASLRRVLRHPVLTALSVLGIALGVAVVVAIDLANDSARRAFTLSSEGVSGLATDHILGGPAGVEETFYVALRRQDGALLAAPIVEDFVGVPREPGRAFRLLGVDPFSERPLRSFLGNEHGGLAGELLRTRGAVLLTAATARRLGLTLAEDLIIQIAGVERRLTLVGLLESEGAGAAAALDDLLLVDISTAQEVLGRVGYLSRIDLALPDSDVGQSARARVRAMCGDLCTVVSASARTSATVQMTRAFALNLNALSLLALLVGMFLIYNTMTFSVVARRPLLGTLRALGVRRREVFSLVLGEALALGIAATSIGLLMGVWLATHLLALVTRTINDLYFVLNVQTLALDSTTLAKGIVLGVGATVLAAAAPAWEATLVAPAISLRRSEAETKLVKGAGRLALVGVALGVGASLLLATSQRSLLRSYVGLFAVVLAFALLVPWTTRLLANAVRPILGWAFGSVGRMAARGIVTSLSRTSVALAALAIAIATTVGVGVMVQSFRDTVIVWLGSTLQSDVFIAPPSIISRRAEGTLLPEVVERLASTPGVIAVNTVRSRRVRTSLGEVDLHVRDMAGGGQPDTFAKRESTDVQPLLRDQQVVAVSEPFAFHHGVELGQKLDIATDRGLLPFRVVAVYRDFASDEGGLLMGLPIYLRLFADRGVSAMGVVLAEGVDHDALRERLRQRAGAGQTLTIRANRELREASLAIFDRTFAITRVLRLLAVGVAFMGVLSALMALALERQREIAVLRAIGMTPRRVAGLVTLQTALLGLFAGVLAIPLGLVLAYILVFVINRRSFGWSLEMHIPGAILAEALVLAVAASLLAGLYPAWKMSRTSAARALREE